MKTATFEYLCRVVAQTNILPIISGCNVNCVFCSHKNNPRNINTYTVPKLGLSEVEQLFEYLSTDKKIVIGESASRIVEGEPFLYKDFMYILKKIRQKYKFTPIQVTTNGSFLTEEVVRELAQLEPIEMNISLNSSSEENRKKLINDKNPEVAIKACHLLNQYNIKYNGSIVAMPDIVGSEDIKNTIEYLCKNNAQLIRIFIPGITRYSKGEYDFYQISNIVNQIKNSVKENYDTPVTIEPSIIKNLNAEIEGVIKDSPSYLAGLKSNDIIKLVNGVEPICRVDAYMRAYSKSNPIVLIERNGEELEIEINKSSKQSCGFVVSYDIDPDIIFNFEKLICRNKSIVPLILTSELACNTLKMFIKKYDKQYKAYPVRNTFFGGTIMVCGLLTISDILNCIEDIKSNYNPDLLILPSVMFDCYGEDLEGIHYRNICEITGINTEIL